MTIPKDGSFEVPGVAMRLPPRSGVTETLPTIARAHSARDL